MERLDLTPESTSIHYAKSVDDVLYSKTPDEIDLSIPWLPDRLSIGTYLDPSWVHIIPWSTCPKPSLVLKDGKDEFLKKIPKELSDAVITVHTIVVGVIHPAPYHSSMYS